MSGKIERLGSVRNGKPVIAIDKDLLDDLEALDAAPGGLVLPKLGGARTGKGDSASAKATRAADDKPVKPKLTGEG